LPRSVSPSQGSVHAQDKAKERAPVIKVLLDNAKVRVTESERQKRARRRSTSARPATSIWLEADSDVVKNIGKTTFVVVSVTPK
jgi:hypothetical protein